MLPWYYQANTNNINKTNLTFWSLDKKNLDTNCFISMQYHKYKLCLHIFTHLYISIFLLLKWRKQIRQGNIILLLLTIQKQKFLGKLYNFVTQTRLDPFVVKTPKNMYVIVMTYHFQEAVCFGPAVVYHLMWHFHLWKGHHALPETKIKILNKLNYLIRYIKYQISLYNIQFLNSFLQFNTGWNTILWSQYS